MFTRTRRLRRNFLTRELVKNISIEKSSLIYPLFVCDGENIKSEIESMPEQYRYSLDRLNEELDELLKLGINNILLFGIPNHKDEIGSQAYDENGIVQRAVRQIRKDYQDKFLIVTDVCMCEYTSHGHCGILHNHDVDNDETLEYIAKIALSHAKAGADIIAPSDMMDGRIAKIREILDKNDFKDIKQKWVDCDSVFDYRNVSDMSVILKFSQTGNDSLSVTLSREEIDTNDENAKIILKHFEAFAKVLIKDINQYIKNMEELETAILDKLISQINSIPTSAQEAEKRLLIIDGAINEDWILKERCSSYSSFIAELKKNISVVDLSSGEVVDIDENIKDTTLFDYLKNNLVDCGFKNPNQIHVFTEKEYNLVQKINIENNFQYLFNNFTSSYSSGGKIIDDLFEQCDVNSTKRFNINNIYVKSPVFSRKDFNEQDIDAILSNKKTLIKNLFNIDGYESVTNNKILFVKNSADCLQSSFSFHCAVDVNNRFKN